MLRFAVEDCEDWAIAVALFLLTVLKDWKKEFLPCDLRLTYRSSLASELLCGGGVNSLKKGGFWDSR